MREIKFRAWEKELKEMVHVDDISFQWRQINTASEWRHYDKVELMQYTGLKDRNGVEIYEHDIFRFGGRNYVIIYNLGSFGCFEDDKYFPLGEIFYRNGEVAGNIYENKELLEREAE